MPMHTKCREEGVLMELSLATRQAFEHAILEVGGEIDVYTAPRLRERLIELIDGGQLRIVVDLSRVEFLDSTGLGVLVGAHRRLRANEGTLSLVCPNDRLLKIFRVSGLDSRFAIHASVADATAATRAGA
jgi:anti-sigma B factor antagonist